MDTGARRIGSQQYTDDHGTWYAWFLIDFQLTRMLSTANPQLPDGVPLRRWQPIPIEMASLATVFLRDECCTEHRSVFLRAWGAGIRRSDEKLAISFDSATSN
jgi:hypothetical protein